MAKPPYYRIFIKAGDKHYLVARLWQQSSDESLMLQVEPSKQSNGGSIGMVPITGDRFEIQFDDINTPSDIDHTSIHASGQSHTKLKDGSRSINYDKENTGIPLRNLHTIKHLGTLITREMLTADESTPSRASDVIIERDPSQKSSVIDILALPKSINVKFNAEWDMENDRQVVLTIGLHRLGFNGLDVFILTRSSDQFDAIPAKSIHLPDMNNIVPFVVSLDDKKAVIQLSSLTFDELIVPENGDDPYNGFTVITATPKWL